MMMAPKATEAAGDKFAPIRSAPARTSSSSASPRIRIVVEKFADYWNKDQFYIDGSPTGRFVDLTMRLANLKSGSLDLIERVLATDIKDVRGPTRSSS